MIPRAAATAGGAREQQEDGGDDAAQEQDQEQQVHREDDRRDAHDVAVDGGHGVVRERGIARKADVVQSRGRPAGELWHRALEALEIVDPGRAERIVAEHDHNARGVPARREEDAEAGWRRLLAGPQHAGHARLASDLGFELGEPAVEEPALTPGAWTRIVAGARTPGAKPSAACVGGALGARTICGRSLIWPKPSRGDEAGRLPPRARAMQTTAVSAAAGRLAIR